MRTKDVNYIMSTTNLVQGKGNSDALVIGFPGDLFHAAHVAADTFHWTEVGEWKDMTQSIRPEVIRGRNPLDRLTKHRSPYALTVHMPLIECLSVNYRKIVALAGEVPTADVFGIHNLDDYTLVTLGDELIYAARYSRSSGFRGWGERGPVRCQRVATKGEWSRTDWKQADFDSFEEAARHYGLCTQSQWCVTVEGPGWCSLWLKVTGSERVIWLTNDGTLLGVEEIQELSHLQESVDEAWWTELELRHSAC